MEKKPKEKEIKNTKSEDLQNESDSSEDESNLQDENDPTRYGDWEKGGRCIDF